MSSKDTRIVQTDVSKRAHLVVLGVHFDGEGKALCGASPFPERWYMPARRSDFKDVCVPCLTERRKHLDERVR